ncbi:MAG TPA: hypothetical protein VFZ65_22335, partial [Planctomycetota bacterium]|nr:hypothetical protein [Planctomycetota bacterium]
MASERATRSRPRWQKVLLALAVGSAAALVLAEVTVRVVKWIVDPGMVTASQLSSGIAAKPAPGQPYRLGHLIRAARNPDIIFELVPGLDVEFQGVRVVTNADGFRGPRRSREKPANGYRIVGLGDSVLFGW